MPRPSAAGAIYDGLQVSVRRRFAKGLTLSGGYTLARQKDSSSSAFYVANNSFNVSDEWSNGTGDQRNTLNINGTYQLKWGFQFSGSYHFGSGADFSDSAGTSPFGNGASTNRTFVAGTKVYDNPAWNYPDPLDPAYELLKRNSLYGRPLHRVDLRLSKTFIVKEHFRFVANRRSVQRSESLEFRLLRDGDHRIFLWSARIEHQSGVSAAHDSASGAFRVLR